MIEKGVKILPINRESKCLLGEDQLLCEKTVN